jgi:pimeloyl-ACP methyl ester carboxylesterase
MTGQELQVYVEAFCAGGLTGPINWYRNLARNSEILAGTSDRITAPCLMISAEDDIFLPPDLVDGMEQYAPDLEKHVISQCGHWTQAEKPDEINRLILDWLGRRFAPV